MTIKKPMLAETCEDLEKLNFPVLASPKLDGIRALKINNEAMSRKFIAIPNTHIQSLFAALPDGLDGELMVNGQTFNQIQSSVMTEGGAPNIEYWVFDYVKSSLKTPYEQRMKDLSALALPPFCIKVIPKLINNVNELMICEAECLAAGYEGVMIRSPGSPYKCGRSTAREGYLLKIKRFKDSEAVVLDLKERMHNANEAEIDELGHTKRSSHKANLIPDGTLGKFVVRDLTSGIEFDIGTGMDDALRQEVWDNKKNYIDKIVKYKYQEAGMKDKPRFPVFLGFRDPRDISE